MARSRNDETGRSWCLSPRKDVVCSRNMRRVVHVRTVRRMTSSFRRGSAGSSYFMYLLDVLKTSCKTYWHNYKVEISNWRIRCIWRLVMNMPRRKGVVAWLIYGVVAGLAAVADGPYSVIGRMHIIS